MRNYSLLDLPKQVWWLILSIFNRSDIFQDNFLKSELRKFINDPSFRGWLMQLYKISDDVYDIDIDSSFLQPLNTITIRKCKIDHTKSVWGMCSIYRCKCNNTEPLQIGFWGFGGEKIKYDEWLQIIGRTDFSQRLNYKFRTDYDNTYKNIQLHQKELREIPLEGERFTDVLIEGNNIRQNSHTFNHNWDRHDITDIDNHFNLSNQTRQAQINLRFDREDKPVNFPKPQKIKPLENLNELTKKFIQDRNIIEYKVKDGRHYKEFTNPLSLKELYDTSKLFVYTQPVSGS